MAKQKHKYVPAELCDHRKVWQIEYYYVSPSKEMIRYRRTFHLNSIRCRRERKKRGRDLVRKLNWWMRNGYHPDMFEEAKADRMLPENLKASIHEEKTYPRIIPTIQEAAKLRCLKKRADTIRTYTHTVSLFVQWVEKSGNSDMELDEFRLSHAQDYLDHCLADRRLSGRAMNNTIELLRSFFADMYRRHDIEKNPWKSIRPYKQKESSRRGFRPEEIRVVIPAVRRKNERLFLALLLEYTCVLRPTEMRRLRRRDIDLELGIVRLSSSQAKVGVSRVATIPSTIIPLLPKKILDTCPPNFLLFGRLFRPHYTKSCGRNTMNNIHRKILVELHENGALPDIEGLSWYSWKNTGITEMIDQFGIIPAQDQAGHADPKETLRYRRKPMINTKIQGWKPEI